MIERLQSTRLRKNLGQSIDRLEGWAVNPWRRYSLFLISLLIGFFIGSSIGMINGVLALMDPVGAFWIVLIIEIMIRSRKSWISSERNMSLLGTFDFARIGLLYGLLSEGFKLL